MELQRYLAILATVDVRLMILTSLSYRASTYVYTTRESLRRAGPSATADCCCVFPGTGSQDFEPAPLRKAIRRATPSAVQPLTD